MPGRGSAVARPSGGVGRCGGCAHGESAAEDVPSGRGPPLTGALPVGPGEATEGIGPGEATAGPPLTGGPGEAVADPSLTGRPGEAVADPSLTGRPGEAAVGPPEPCPSAAGTALPEACAEASEVVGGGET